MHRQALEAASKGGQDGIRQLESLRTHGHQLDAADYDGRTVFHVAAAEFNVDVLTYLFEVYSSNPNLDFIKVAQSLTIYAQSLTLYVRSPTLYAQPPGYGQNREDNLGNTPLDDAMKNHQGIQIEGVAITEDTTTTSEHDMVPFISLDMQESSERQVCTLPHADRVD